MIERGDDKGCRQASLTNADRLSNTENSIILAAF
jgi:hypothetical protein